MLNPSPLGLWFSTTMHYLIPKIWFPTTPCCLGQKQAPLRIAECCTENVSFLAGDSVFRVWVWNVYWKSYLLSLPFWKCLRTPGLQGKQTLTFMPYMDSFLLMGLESFLIPVQPLLFFSPTDMQTYVRMWNVHMQTCTHTCHTCTHTRVAHMTPTSGTSHTDWSRRS